MAKDFLYILGVPNFANYEASASLIQVPREGGEIKYVCIGEDRLTRVKHTYMFPLRGIHYCLQALGLESLEQVDYIYSDYARLPRWLNSGPGYRKLEHDYLKLQLNYPRERIRVVNHHDAHAASAYYPSGFDEAAVLIVDALGCRLETQSLYHFRGNECRVIERGSDWGIGRLYSLVTSNVLPYGPEKGFGKTMGLAPYGADHPGPVLEFNAKDEGMTSDYSAFFTRAPISRIVGSDVRQCDDRERILEPYFARAAFDVQEECERQMVRMARYAHQKTGCRNLCIAGGGALNVVANRRVLEETDFEQVWIQPGASDTGVSFGLALWGYFQELIPQEPARTWVSMPTAYTGRSYDRASIVDLMNVHEIDHKPTTPEEVAWLIAEGNVVAWFEGRSEFGPRSLGHRSILADPRDPEMKDRLNSSIKFREGFRPYAPSTLMEHASNFLDLDAASPFMLNMARVREEKRHLTPGVTHVDGTTRPQTVTLEDNGDYYRMITAFNVLTGVPMVLNSSLNVNREPIVETPLDALICSFSTAIDYLYIQGLLVECQPHRRPELADALSAERQRLMDDEWDLITKKYLVRYDPEERDRYLAEENHIAEWHRDYRSKYELEKAMLRWRLENKRVLIVGTRAHTQCLYMYIPEFPQIDVRAFVPLDDLPGERSPFSVYPEFDLESVQWAEIDEILISTHEYQRIAMRMITDINVNKPVLDIYDDAGDSLIYVLPGRWPIMNPIEVEHHNVTTKPRASLTIDNADTDFQPPSPSIGNRHAIILTYHYCHPDGGSDFKGLRGIRPDDLDEQIRLLRQHFQFASVGQLLDPRADLPGPIAVITFDDGLKDQFKYALPILRHWQVPATLFCCSAPLRDGRVLNVHRVHLLQGHLGLEAFRREFHQALANYGSSYQMEDPHQMGIRDLYRYDDEPTREFKTLLNYRLPYNILTSVLQKMVEEVFGPERDVAERLYMSEEELRECMAVGMEVGIHSHSHNILSRLSEQEQRDELSSAAAFFSDRLNVTDLPVAYPYGGTGTWNNITEGLLQELGFSSGLTMSRKIVKPKDLSAPWTLPRFDVLDLFDRENKIRPGVIEVLVDSD